MPAPTNSDPIPILFSLLPFIVVAIYLLVFRDFFAKKPAKERCLICLGTGKLPDEAHDSSDIQFVRCENCDGDGLIKPKKDGGKHGLR